MGHQESEVRGTLEDIEELTLSTIGPFVASIFSEGIESGYKEYETADRLTTYLIFAHKGRALFYGVDIQKRRFTIPALEGDPRCEEYLTSLYTPCLFAHRGDVTAQELADIVCSSSDYDIGSLESLAPGEEETDKEFFLRNAMWLLNPMVH